MPNIQVRDPRLTRDIATYAENIAFECRNIGYPESESRLDALEQHRRRLVRIITKANLIQSKAMASLIDMAGGDIDYFWED